MSFTAEQLKAAEYGKNFAWDARKIPSEFDPVQLETGPSGVFDWWNTRGSSLCCFFPFLRCLSGHEKVDAKDLTHWKKQLASPSNKDCPESMQGLWWLKYNHAPEELVTIFGDCSKWTGTFNKEGTDGFGEWKRPLRHNWSRENALFGLIFSVWGNRDTSVVVGRMNLKDGICTVHGKEGEGIQVVYRVNDNEWWKIHYRGNPGEDGENDVEFMYKWLKVVDADGKPTEHWDEWQDWVDEPLPHQGCGCGEYKSCFWPFWGSCLSGKQVAYNMIRPNKTQVVNFRV